MDNIVLIKTLPHLQTLFTQESSSIHSNSYSLQIFNTLQSAKVLKLKDVKFSEFLNKIANLESSSKNENVDEEFIVGDNLKYERVDYVNEKYQFSIKGDVISIWLIGYQYPIKLEFFGEECEKIYTFDTLTNRKVADLDEIIFCSFLPSSTGEANEIALNVGRKTLDVQAKSPRSKVKAQASNLKRIIFTNRTIDGIHKFHSLNELNVITSDFVFPQLFFSRFDNLEKEVERLQDQGYKIYINSRTKSPINIKINDLEDITLKFDNESYTFEEKELKKLPAGFISTKNKIAFFTDRELYGQVDLRKADISGTSSQTLKQILRQFEGQINIGDYVVHEDYGVAIYSGLKQEEIDEVQNDYLLLEFANKDELYVPIDQLRKITKYLGNDGGEAKLSLLGKTRWTEIKNKVRKTVLLTAEELIKHFAKRELSTAAKVENKDSEAYLKFVDRFPFDETNDQIRTINEVINDLEKDRPMNRLVVGDVGFGKTEVIMRAAFKIAEGGGQVAVLSPTTVLTAQHDSVFKDRFRDSGFVVKSVSRFNTNQENRKIIDEANEGKIDILIGTHRLLSSDVKFKNLQLLVVDEEQKFGVKQKEKIKQLNYGVHVLSVSATPIPRSLSLALSAIQDISIIATPPVNRKNISTEIIFNNWETAANGIQTEVSRGGQVYFVHNRVQSIQGIKTKLQEMLPNIKFEFAHGQMPGAKLDDIFTDFYLKKFDVLISTTIIENGLDLENVNTIVIHDAHKFGLSQLYQMRGRVGRSAKQAYCYLMAPTTTDLNKQLEEASAAHPTKGVVINGKKHDPIFIPNNYESEYVKKLEKEKQKRNSKAYLDRLQSLVDNQDLGAGFRIASKDLEIRGAGNILGEQQHGYINTIGYALYIEMLADAIEKLKGG